MFNASWYCANSVQSCYSNEDMILALAGQFKQLSHEPEKFRWLNSFEPMTSAMPVQCSNQLSYEVTQLRAGQFVGLMFSRERNVVWKMCYMKCGVWNQMKIWSSHLLDNLSNCLMNLKNSGDSTGFEPMTSAMTHLSYYMIWLFCVALVSRFLHGWPNFFRPPSPEVCDLWRHFLVRNHFRLPSVAQKRLVRSGVDLRTVAFFVPSSLLSSNLKLIRGAA